MKVLAELVVGNHWRRWAHEYIPVILRLKMKRGLLKLCFSFGGKYVYVYIFTLVDTGSEANASSKRYFF